MECLLESLFLMYRHHISIKLHPVLGLRYNKQTSVVYGNGVDLLWDDGIITGVHQEEREISHSLHQFHTRHPLPEISHTLKPQHSPSVVFVKFMYRLSHPQESFVAGSSDFRHVQRKPVAVVTSVSDFAVSPGGVSEVNERGFPQELRAMSPHEGELFGGDAM